MYKQAQITLDQRGFIKIDGVTIGRGFVTSDGRPVLQVKDKNPQRCVNRGTPFVAVDLYQLAATVEGGGVKARETTPALKETAESS